jgi:hypothetical protein
MGAKTRLHRLLEERVAAVVAEYSISLIGGQAVDFAGYRESCGYIRGLTDALKLCDDIEGDLDR